MYSFHQGHRAGYLEVNVNCQCQMSITHLGFKDFFVGNVPRLCEIQELCMTSARTGGSVGAAAGHPCRSCRCGYEGLEEEEMTLLSTYVYHWEKLCFLEKFGSSIVLEKSCSTSLVRGALVPGNQRRQVGHCRGAVPCLQVQTVRTTGDGSASTC